MFFTIQKYELVSNDTKINEKWHYHSNMFNKRIIERGKVTSPFSALPVQRICPDRPWEKELRPRGLSTHTVLSWRDIIYCKHGSCSVLGCTNDHKTLCLVPPSETIFSGNAPNISPTSSTWSNTKLDLRNVWKWSPVQYQLSSAQLQHSKK